MRMSHSTLLIIAAFLLQGCAATHGRTPTQVATNYIHKQQVTPTTAESYPAKSPQFIALYMSNQTPHTAYKIIGVASVSKYNLLGMQRESVDMHGIMKNLAASIGGDALINVSDNEHDMQANVIQFQKILI